MKEIKEVSNFCNVITVHDCYNDRKNDEMNQLQKLVLEDLFRKPAMRNEDHFRLFRLIADRTSYFLKTSSLCRF